MLSLEVVKTTLLSSTRGQLYSFSKGCPSADSSELNPWTKQCTIPLDVLNTHVKFHIVSINARSVIMKNTQYLHVPQHCKLDVLPTIDSRKVSSYNCTIVRSGGGRVVVEESGGGESGGGGEWWRGEWWWVRVVAGVSGGGVEWWWGRVVAGGEWRWEGVMGSVVVARVVVGESGGG